MKLTIFSKSMKSKEDRKFKVYLTRLKKKDGEEVPVRVSWAEGVVIPNAFPCIIIVEKKDANLSQKKYTDSDGNPAYSYTLWVNDYKPSGEEYVDHSLDEYED